MATTGDQSGAAFGERPSSYAKDALARRRAFLNGAKRSDDAPLNLENGRVEADLFKRGAQATADGLYEAVSRFENRRSQQSQAGQSSGLNATQPDASDPEKRRVEYLPPLPKERVSAAGEAASSRYGTGSARAYSPEGGGGAGGGSGGGNGDGGNTGGNGGSGAMADDNLPDTSALNSQIVQAVQFTNAEVDAHLADMVSVPAEVMATQTAGHANQNAESYMNGVMQISMAAQAVVARKIAENPATAAVDAPALVTLQEMVTAAISAFGTASTTAGTAAKTIIGDVKI
ncbi:hypothetical protein [Polycladidibacter hongkongensis]|uniref:hypothetical protein n=1 Tax=Polycladidibacter hongkongensis TaxID=1647556 RepID=UPI000829C9C0|nr:hypothetical protein [Pseudovibrio hongkongensis]